MEPSSVTTLSSTYEAALAAILPITIRGISAIVVLLLALMIAERARRATVRSVGRTKADPSIAVFVGRFAHLGAVIVGVLIALGILGISWTALLAVVGAVSLAISLAIQDILKNFVAGLYLLMERPFRVGETVKIKDFIGTVEDIGIRTTALRTTDDLQVVVPNATMFAEVVVNFSVQARRQDPNADGEEPAEEVTTTDASV